MAEFNPRFVEFSRAHSMSPEEMSAKCKATNMSEFLRWSSMMLQRARISIPSAFTRDGRIIDHSAYDAWMHLEVDRLLQEAEQ